MGRRSGSFGLLARRRPWEGGGLAPGLEGLEGLRDGGSSSPRTYKRLPSSSHPLSLCLCSGSGWASPQFAARLEFASCFWLAARLLLLGMAAAAAAAAPASDPLRWNQAPKAQGLAGPRDRCDLVSGTHSSSIDSRIPTDMARKPAWKCSILLGELEYS